MYAWDICFSFIILSPNLEGTGQNLCPGYCKIVQGEVISEWTLFPSKEKDVVNHYVTKELPVLNW